jgi:hypothetical protein
MEKDEDITRTDKLLEATDANRLVLWKSQNQAMALKIAVLEDQVQEYKEELFLKGKSEEERKEILQRFVGRTQKAAGQAKEEVLTLDIDDAAKVELIFGVIKENQEIFEKRLKQMALEYEMQKGADNLILR